MAAVTVGVLGGAFDPPHVGHVALARAGVERFGLDRLLVRVVAEPGAQGRRDATPQIRLALARLAFASLAGAEVALDPFARTVDSLEALALDDPVFLSGPTSSPTSWLEGARAASSSSRGSASRRGPASTASGVDAVLARLDRPDRVTFFEIEPHAGLVVGDPRARRRRRVDRPASSPPRSRREIAPSRPLRGRWLDRGVGGMLRSDPSERTTPT